MPLQFNWQPNNNPVATSGVKRFRQFVGLRLGGDETEQRLSSLQPTDGLIRLYEVCDTAGANKGAGTAEQPGPRLIATFHGKFHRKTSSPTGRRITFELFGYDKAFEDYDGLVSGFDPECMLGIDAFVVTFLNREFVIYLPFFLDRRSEGEYMEIQAKAFTLAGTTESLLRESSILRMRIRRIDCRVITTTGGNMEYNGNVVGNIIAFHEDYIINGGMRPANQARQNWTHTRLFPAPLTGPDRIPFSSYSPGSLQILLTTDILQALVPNQTYLQNHIGDIATVNGGAVQATNDARSRMMGQIRANLRRMLEDAGFKDLKIFWQGETAAQALLRPFMSAFSYGGHSGQWMIINANSPLETGFWNFFITNDNTLSYGGIAEGLIPDIAYEYLPNGGTLQYLLTTSTPIGSGNKKIKSPVKIKGNLLVESITGSDGSRSYPTLNPVAGKPNAVNFRDALDALADKTAILIVHEIAHSLGLQHTLMIGKSEPFYEKYADSALDIMCGYIDQARSFGRNMVFSNQAKLIWKNVFKTTPASWNGQFLLNKTWGTDYKTVAWSDRRLKLARKNFEDTFMSSGYVLGTAKGPPFDAGVGPKVQPGTYIP
jgi:hypothetical protein